MFYFKPPRGEIHREKLRSLAGQRFRFLLDLSEDSELATVLAKNLEASTAVLEGTSKDRVSHFALKLAAAHHKALAWTVSRQESVLFRQRIGSVAPGKLRSFVLEFKRHVKEQLLSSFSTTLRAIHDALADILDHEDFFSADEAQEGPAVRLSFHMVPSLVRRRAVIVHRGLAVVTRSVIPDFLCDIFEQLQLLSVQKWQRQQDEEQIELAQDLAEECLSIWQKQDGSEKMPVLKANLVKAASAFFPLCYQSVYSTLLRENRLRHSARVAFTLFLKDIGMPHEEAVKFWSFHYSKPALKTTGCTHGWQSGRARYIYNIRHLYGMEGSRKDYSSHSCEAIMGRDSSVSEQLLCPFKVNSAEELRLLLPTIDASAYSRIIDASQRGRYKTACQSCASLSCGTSTVFERVAKPSQYYRTLASSVRNGTALIQMES